MQFRPVLLCAVVMATTACCHSSGCPGSAALLTDRPDKPRAAVFGLRSFSGSRTALLLTAGKLFRVSPDLKLTGDSSIEIYAAEGSAPGYLAASILCQSQLSIEELVRLGQGVEQRLADPKHPGARSTLRVDLMWVEGVALKSPRLELPNPELFTNSWAIGTFMGAAEEAIPTRSEAERFRAALEKAPGPHEIGRDPLLPPELAFSPAPRPQHDVWKVEGTDWPDGLAAAAYALGVIQFEREQRVTNPDNAFALPHAKNAVKKVRSEAVEFVEASAPAGASDSEIARLWLVAVSDALRTHHMRIATAVVFEAAKDRTRGAVVGAVASEKLVEVRLTGLTADRDPEDSRFWANFHGFSNVTRVVLEVEHSPRDAKPLDVKRTPGR